MTLLQNVKHYKKNWLSLQLAKIHFHDSKIQSPVDILYSILKYENSILGRGYIINVTEIFPSQIISNGLHYLTQLSHCANTPIMQATFFVTDRIYSIYNLQTQANFP